MKRAAWIPYTEKQWKVRKRRQLKAIIHAVDDYQRGCAYTPNYQLNMDTLRQTLKQMSEDISAKNWGH